MIQIKYLLFFFLIGYTLSLSAQSKHSGASGLIKTALAAYSIHAPGNIAIDKNGDPISKQDTLFVIYIETSFQKIHWENAWKDGREYTLMATLLPASSFEAGTAKATNEKIFLQPAGRNKLWQLQLVPGDKFFSPPPKALRDKIILQGIYRSKKITVKINRLTEINSTPAF